MPEKKKIDEYGSNNRIQKDEIKNKLKQSNVIFWHLTAKLGNSQINELC